MSKTIGPYRLDPRGDYNPAADPLYSLLDLVSDGGGSFVYINDTPSNEPTSSASHWQQIASQGTTGPSAYDAAVAGGYMGTEAEFNTANAGIEAAKDEALGAAETANEAAENAETAAYRSMLWRKTASGNPVSVYPVPESPLYPKVSGSFVQSGTGDPSPSSTRPITPWLASGGQTKVKRTGKNLFNPQYLTRPNGELVRLYQDVGFLVKSGITYTVSSSEPFSSLYVDLYPGPGYIGEGLGVKTLTFTPSVTQLITFVFYFASGVPVGTTYQLELGSTATPYEPYTESEITLTAPQEIPAGWMDNEGNGQMTYYKKVFDGTEPWHSWHPDYMWAHYVDLVLMGFPRPVVLSDNYQLPEGLRCSHLPLESAADVVNVSITGCALATAGRIVMQATVGGTRIVTLSDWKAYLAAQYAAGTPVTVVYPLATPITLTPPISPLTAAPQLDRVTPRQNVLTASTGNVELTYAKSSIRESDELAAAIAALS